MGKWLQALVLACKGAVTIAFCLSGGLSLGVAAPVRVDLLPIETPELPPLGDSSRFLPLEEFQRELINQGTYLSIDLSDRRVYLYQGDELLASYQIAIGKAGWETPLGNYKVMQMIRNPAWEHPWTGEIVPPGPDNPLGTRWIGFWTDGVNYIGFHGTPNESSVGQAASHGCVRMFDKDVVALFEQVEIGTPVLVLP